MTTDQIVSMILAIAPSVVTILTMLGVILRVLKDFRDLKLTVTDMKSVEEVNDRLKSLVQENYELKKTMRELLTKIDHVERK